jgi:calcium/calmodulin-dependent protein kinase I
MSSISEDVADSKLETVFVPNGRAVQHRRYVAGNQSSRRRAAVTETWIRKKLLGRGGFGAVWLEQCHGSGEVRAVKEMQKQVDKDGSPVDFSRELEAIAKFSRQRVGACCPIPQFPNCACNVRAD